MISLGLPPHGKRGGEETSRSNEETPMPLIEVHLLTGRTDEQKKALLTAITKAVNESIGAPLETIRIWIEEFSPKEYMAAGVWYGDKNK
jgi:4-oxalocrotonate tautomerase